MKKAFTLVELLGVIIILGVLALIVFPIIDKSIKQSKEKALQATIASIEDAANKYSVEHDLGYSTSYQKMNLSELVNSGYLKDDLINPVTNSKLNGCVLYKWDEEYNQYEFKYEEECSIKTIYETVLEQYPYLATNGNGCVTSTENNYSYMGGCYLKGGSQSGKDMFYSTMNNNGIDNDTVTQTFFDDEGNFMAEKFENWYRNFVKEQGITDEQIDQMLQESGKNTVFEMAFSVTPEELFAKQSINKNSLWYSGFLWRIMGINADGTVRLITDEIVTSIPWGASDTAENWDGSHAKDWLNNYFYSRLKGNDIIVEQTWCSETTTDYGSARTTCSNNLSTQPAYVGLITVDEINLAGGGGDGGSYLKVEQLSFTMTPCSSSAVWGVGSTGGPGKDNDVSRNLGLRPVINVNSDVTITSGNGTLEATWSSEVGPYILNEDKNIEVTGNLNKKATSGEYVLFAGKKYRVVDKDSNGNTKLILDGYYEEDGSIFEMKYGDNNTFSTTTGIGQKLNGDVLNWLTNNNDTEKGKLVSDYTWYQNNFDYGQSYAISLNEENPTRTTSATVGLIRVGEMLSGQSSSILTKGYTATSSDNNASIYWTMTPGTSSSSAWYMGYHGDVYYASVTGTLGVRAVIVVNSDVTITSGNGTWSSPYEI